MVTRAFIFFVGIEPILKQMPLAAVKLTLCAAHNTLKCNALRGALTPRTEGMIA
jgi:hypothetical protein